jgi:hypothetical protein
MAVPWGSGSQCLARCTGLYAAPIDIYIGCVDGF